MIYTIFQDYLLKPYQISSPEENRRVQKPRLLNPVAPFQFPTTITTEYTGVACLAEEIFAGKDCGDACVYGSRLVSRVELD